MRVIPSLLEFLRGAKAPRCSRCGEPILQTHRWHLVYRRFLWFRWTTKQHRHCDQPHLDPVITHLAGKEREYAVTRLNREEGYILGGSEVANAILHILYRLGETRALDGVLAYMKEHGIEPLEINPIFTARPIPNRQYSDLFGPTEEELARSIYELGKETQK